jgi:hypothetical protein
MKAHAARRRAPPDVDEGDARNLAALLRRELRPTPGRLGDSLRIVVIVLAAVTTAETFRIPEIAVSAYIVLFLSGREAVTIVRTSLAAGIAVVLAIFATIAVFMLSLSEPAQRQRFLCAWRRYIDRRNVRADGARHGAHRGGAGPRTVTDQRRSACFRDRCADIKCRFRHPDRSVTLLVNPQSQFPE